MDEVGRGCWAGPLCVAAVILHQAVPGLRDSKTLSEKQRLRLAAAVRRQAEIGIGWVPAALIDRVGLTRAQELAMAAAVAQLRTYDHVIIDGHINYLPGHHVPVDTVVKADRSVPAVSAAAIIAKTARDNFMKNIAQRFPEYGFGVHVGYGTSHHRQQLERHGVTPLHRLSFKPVGLIAARQPSA